MYLVFATFSLLLSLSLLYAEERRQLTKRTGEDWAIDATGLLVQGVLVPFLQTVAIWSALNFFAPKYAGTLEMSPLLAFLLNFVVVDYLYYWNHRTLHSRWLWSVHLLHHTPEALDVMATSRNTLWSPLFIVYIWVNGLFLYLLSEPSAYLFGISLTAALDLWRHSTFYPKRDGACFRMLSRVLITPHEHAWHHSEDKCHVNFGANFNIWDRLHGTYHCPTDYPQSLGVKVQLPFWKKLLFPFVLDQAERTEKKAR